MFLIILLPFVGFIQMSTLIPETFQNNDNSTLFSSISQNKSDSVPNSSSDENIIFEDHSDEGIEKNEHFEDNEDKGEIKTDLESRSQMKLSFSELTLSMYKVLAENKEDNFVFSPLR